MRAYHPLQCLRANELKLVSTKRDASVGALTLRSRNNDEQRKNDSQEVYMVCGL
jgi:hypothetical protein